MNSPVRWQEPASFACVPCTGVVIPDVTHGTGRELTLYHCWSYINRTLVDPPCVDYDKGGGSTWYQDWVGRTHTGIFYNMLFESHKGPFSHIPPKEHSFKKNKRVSTIGLSLSLQLSFFFLFPSLSLSASCVCVCVCVCVCFLAFALVSQGMGTKITPWEEVFRIPTAPYIFCTTGSV